MNKNNNWVPEIVYEEDSDLAGLPMIVVPDNEIMPPLLFIWEVSSTGEFEPGPEGEEIPIVDYKLKHFAQMDLLKDKLSAEDYDKVRLALGLSPLKEAIEAGKKITQNIKNNVL